MRLIIAFINLVFCACLTLQAQTPCDSAALRALQVGRVLPQEKVYLHFDNSSYYLGETIWFKAFVTCYTSNEATDFSKVLYVELMSPEGYVVKTDKYKIGENGTCSGHIYMDPLYLSGYYEIRAYTRYMLNWGDEAIFSRVIPVFDKVHNGDWDFRNIRDRSKLVFGNRLLSKEKEPELRFYPESGHLVAGISSRVAYELTGFNGVDIYNEITLFANGKELLRTTPVHLGRGDFTLKPQGGVKYTAKVWIKNNKGKDKLYKFELPQVEKEGIVLSMRENGDSIMFGIGNTVGGGVLGFAVLHGSEIGFYKTFNTDNYDIRIAKSEIPEGVSRAVVFNGREPLAERMFFVQHDRLQEGDTETVRLKVTANGYMLHNVEAKPHEKIEIIVEREDGKPLEKDMEFAVSVTDQAGRLTTSWGYDLYTYLLLGSEVKGYIPDAHQYFDPNNTNRKRDLDLMMLTNGWTAYNWKNLTAPSLNTVVPPEEGITVKGELGLKIRSWSIEEMDIFRIHPQPYNVVRLDFTDRDSIIKAQAFRTDSVGKFSIILDDFYGKQTAALSPNTIFQHGYRINYAFYIDKYFSPKPGTISYWQHKLQSSIRAVADTASGVKKITFNEYLLDCVDIVADYGKDITKTSPISEIRLDYLDEWEYVLDTNYRNVYMQSIKPSNYYDDIEDIHGFENYREELLTHDISGEKDNENGSSINGDQAYKSNIRSTDKKPIIIEGFSSNSYNDVPVVNEIIRSIYKRYNLGWQNWVHPVVIKGEYNIDSIPVADEKYLHGIDPEKMTNFKEIIITSDPKKLETVIGGYGAWEMRANVLANKGYYYAPLYKAFYEQNTIRYDFSETKHRNYETLEKLTDIYIRIEKIKDMRHPNNIVYLIPENRDNKKFIKNDLTQRSSTRRYTSVQGYTVEKQFYTPDYSNMKPDDKDYRRTLMWNPDTKVVDGKLHIELYNSSICNTIGVDVLGMKENRIFSANDDYETRESGRNRTSKARRKRYEKRSADSTLWEQCEKEFERAEIYFKKRNYRRALTTYIDLIQYNYAPAFYRVGEMYLKGINLRKRDDLAAQFFGRGAELGMPECYYELSKMFRNGIHFEQSKENELEMLEIASNMMEPAAMFLLGTYLYNGEFMEKDTVRAVSLFYESAKKGNARAMYEYSLYMSRNGVEKDSVLGTAVECMSKSAEDGFQQAIKWLLEYHDTRQEYSRAYVYAKKLYMLKDVYGTRYMADCYRYGRGVGRDKRLAKDLYRDAAELGCKESEKILQEW